MSARERPSLESWRLAWDPSGSVRDSRRFTAEFPASYQELERRWKAGEA